MKLNTKRTVLIGLAFLSICAFWQTYDNIIPLMLQNTFGMRETVTGVLMAMDNVLAVFLLPFFGALSDRTNTRFGRRMPFIVTGTACAVVFYLLIAAAEKWGPETPILVFSDQTPTDADLNPLAPSLMRYQGQYFETFDYRSILMQNVVTGGAMGINRALARLGGRFGDGSRIIMHDWWLAVVAARFGRIVYIDESLGAYRQHGENAVGAKDVHSVGYIEAKLRHIGDVRASIIRKKAQAQCFSEAYSELLTEADEAFLAQFTRPRSGPLFYLKHRREIHGLPWLAGMMVLG